MIVHHNVYMVMRSLPSSFSQNRSNPSAEPARKKHQQCTTLNPSCLFAKSLLFLNSYFQNWSSWNYHWPVIIPLSRVEYSTACTGPAWHAKTASHDPLEIDHTLAVQSSLPVIKVSSTIRIDLQRWHDFIKQVTRLK